MPGFFGTGAIRHIILAGGLASGVVALATAPNSAADDQCGPASWYSLPGNRTANGEVMNPIALTAAHRTLPFDTVVRVTNLKNGQSLDLRINDRGPYIEGRILDVSKNAANKLGFIDDGVTEICMIEI